MAEQILNDLLMDTHTLMWATTNTEVSKLGTDARDALENAEGKIYVSAISAFELTNKYRKGKLDRYKDLVDQYDEIVSGLGAEELPLTGKHAYDAGMMDWSHRDPFDRMLAAQARCEGLTLVTCDRAFDDAPGVEVLW